MKTTLNNGSPSRDASNGEFHINIKKITEENNYFRKVVYTGQKSQLVIMCIKVGEDVGEEIHEHVEQTLSFVSGAGKAIVGEDTYDVIPGSIVIVPPGVKHNFINSGEENLKLFTVYAPPNHINGRMHVTKEDAEADIEDEEFGHQV